MDELEMVSGGRLKENEDGQTYGRCPDCGALLIKRGSDIVCPDCGYIKDNNTSNATVTGKGSNRGMNKTTLSGGTGNGTKKLNGRIFNA